MFKRLQTFLTIQHHRFMQRARAFGAAAKQLTQNSIRLVNGLGRLALEHYSNSSYESEHRYGTHIWLYIAIRTIAEKSAMPPLVLKRDDEIVESPLPPKPNPSMSWTDVNELLTIWMELCGNAYLYHDTENNEFYPLRPSRMRIVADDDGRNVIGYAYYKGGAPSTNRVDVYSTPSYRSDNNQRKSWMYDNPELENLSESEFKEKLVKINDWITKGIEPTMTVTDPRRWMPLDVGEVLHFKYVSPTHLLYGLSPLTPLLSSLMTDLYARTWNQKFFENGAIPPGILIVAGQMKREQFQEIKREFNEEYEGAGNRGKNIVIRSSEEGATYTPFPGQHRDMEFANMLKTNRDEILSLYNVPHAMVNAQMTETQMGSRSPGIESYRRIFWRDTIQPKHRKKADVWNNHYDLNPEANGIGFAHDYTDIEDLEPDWLARGRAAALGMRNAMTVEEAREKIYKLPAKPEGTLWLPSNVQVVEVSADDAMVETEDGMIVFRGQGRDQQ